MEPFIISYETHFYSIEKNLFLNFLINIFYLCNPVVKINKYFLIFNHIHGEYFLFFSCLYPAIIYVYVRVLLPAVVCKLIGTLGEIYIICQFQKSYRFV